MNVSKLILGLALPVLATTTASAHCDTLDGPVVEAAKKAFAGNDVNQVLIWVQKDGEAEIRQAFQRTMEVRKLGGEAQKMADQYFFEALVRVHRAGEGAPFTGLKPAGLDLGPAVPMADKALVNGDLKQVQHLLEEAVGRRLHQTFSEVMETKNYRPGNVEAGREYIGAYVKFIHSVEGIYKVSTTSGHGHDGHGEAGHEE